MSEVFPVVSAAVSQDRVPVWNATTTAPFARLFTTSLRLITSDGLSRYFMDVSLNLDKYSRAVVSP